MHITATAYELPDDLRVYCENCGSLKGSKKSDIYYPDDPCIRCGTAAACVRYRNGYQVGWDRWLELQAAKQEKKEFGFMRQIGK